MHYLSPTLSGDNHFFGTPSANFDGKVIHYSDEVTRAFLAEAEEKQPDLVILSGDLTLNGAAQSHREMAAYLQQLQVVLVPEEYERYCDAEIAKILARFEQTGRLISCDYELDEGSFLYLEIKTRRIMEKK